MVSTPGGAPPLGETGASDVLCHGCRNADTGRTGTLMEKQTGTKQKKRGGKDCTRRLQVWQNSGLRGVAR